MTIERPDQFIRLDEVKRRAGLGKSMIYRQILDGKFPAPYRVAAGASRWSECEINLWIEEIKRSRGKQPTK